jgi:hypothetical protein
MYLPIFLKHGDFFDFFIYFIQHCFICRSSDSSVSEDAEIESGRTVAALALAWSLVCSYILVGIHKSNMERPVFC